MSGSHCPLHALSVCRSESGDLPYDLMPTWRGVQQIGRRRQAWITENARESLCSIMVEIQVEVPDQSDVGLGPRVRVRLQGIHADVDIATTAGILKSQPGLISRSGQLAGSDQTLNEIVSLLMLDHNRKPVSGLEVVVDVSPGGDGSRLHFARLSVPRRATESQAPGQAPDRDPDPE
jgi:hypothetical protein